MLIIFIARYGYKLLIADHDYSQLRSIKLGVIRFYICGQQWCSPQLSGFGMKSKNSLSNNQRSYLIFSYKSQDFFYFLLFELCLFLELQEREIAIWIRNEIFILHRFNDFSENFLINLKFLFFIFDKLVWKSSRFPSWPCNSSSYQRPFINV
jgi:hypothetical protein